MSRRNLVIAAAAVALLALPVLLRTFVIEAFKIPAGSMIPTLQVGDHIFVDKQKREPRRGDVIVFIYPREPDKDFIKRVIAVGGDRVEWQGEVPVVNGTPIARRAIEGECSYFDFEAELARWDERHCRAFEETVDGRSWRIYQDPHPIDRGGGRSVTVPPGAYYVLGDNRDNSHDSRYWGFVPAQNVKGTATRIWFSVGQKIRTERVGLKVQ